MKFIEYMKFNKGVFMDEVLRNFIIEELGDNSKRLFDLLLGITIYHNYKTGAKKMTINVEDKNWDIKFGCVKREVGVKLGC